MVVSYELKVLVWDWVGKGVVWVLCCEGFLFVVIYGDKKLVMLIIIFVKEMIIILYKGGFLI